MTDVHNLTESQLLKLFADGRDGNAFRELFNRYYRFVWSACRRRLCGREHLVEDAVQAVFVYLFRVGRIRAGCSLPAWLYQTARSATSQILRAEVRRLAREKKAASMNEERQQESLPEADWVEVRRHLDEAIDKLPTKQRDVLVMHFLADKSFMEISNETGIKKATVQKRVAAGLGKLRSILSARNVAVSVSGLEAMIISNSLEAAPAGLGQSMFAAISQNMSSGGMVDIVVGGISKMVFMSKLKVAATIAAAILLTCGVAAGTYLSVADKSKHEHVNPIAAASQKTGVASSSVNPKLVVPAVTAGPYAYVAPPVSSRIEVMWYDPKDAKNIAAYRIYRDGRIIGTLKNEVYISNVYSDSSLSPATRYSYTVTGVDANGNESRPSETVSAMTYPKADRNLDVMIKPSRISGVAPLSVFFDVTETGSFADGSFVDATCVWNFDVDGTDVGGKFRTASGFVAAHVFERPGAYRVRCDVYDAQGRHDSKEIIINAGAFSGQTYYVAADGSDDNPGTIEKPIRSARHALLDLAKPDTRILFRKGDVFPQTEHINADKRNGPVIVSGYSDPRSPSDKAPVISWGEALGSTGILIGSDWRIMDLKIHSGCVGTGGTAENSLIYRLEEDNFDGGVCAGGRFNTIAECNIHDVTGTAYYSTPLESYGNSGGCAIIGNWLHDKIKGRHDNVFVLNGGSRYFIAFNKFEGNYVNFEGLAINGTSNRIVVYRNILDQLTGFRPSEKELSGQYVHHCVVDSNLFVGRPARPEYILDSRLLAMQVMATDMVIRNNIFYNYKNCMVLEDEYGPVNNIKIYNNTAIGIEPGLTFAILGSTCSNVRLFNNLMFRPVAAPFKEEDSFIFRRKGTADMENDSDYNIFFGAGWPAGSFGGSKKTLNEWRSATGMDMHSLTRDPMIANTKLPEIAANGISIIGLDEAALATIFKDFAAPSAGSPAINTGTGEVGRILDFNGKLRDAKPDMGAVEYNNISRD